MIFDTHAHYDDKAFDADRDQLLSEGLKAGGVRYVISCGADLKSSEKAIALAKKYDYIYAAVGVHPEEVGRLELEDSSSIFNMAFSCEKVVAIGEIGLDYHFKENPSPSVQQDWFVEQIELSKELGLPIIVHSRDAMQDTYDILEDYKKGMIGGVIHAYSGAPEMARKFVELGYYLGIGGMVTFDNARRVLDTVKEIPLDHLLIETDCPYLSPVPNRGKRNDSRNLKYVVEKIAQIKGISAEEVEKVTMQNAIDLFSIPMKKEKAEV